MLLVTVVAVAVSVWFYAASKLSHLDSYKESISKTISEELNRNVSYKTGTAALTLRKGLYFRFTDVAVKEKDGATDFVSVHDAFVRVSVLSLLVNRIVLSEIVLQRPRLSIKRDSAGELNIADLLIEREDGRTPKIRKITIEDGWVTILDQALGGEVIAVALENFDAGIQSIFFTNRYRFKITTSVVEETSKAQLALDGFFRQAPSGEPFYESKVRASVRVNGSDLRNYSAYLKKYTPLEHMAGHLDADVKFSGRFSDFKSSGSIRVKNGRLSYPGVFRDILRPQMVALDYDMVRDQQKININVDHLAIDRFNAKGNFGMDDLDKDDPLLKASAVTETFVLREVRSYIPWGIIPEDVGNFIDVHIKNGHFRLVEGTLKGRLSRISDFNARDNAELLSIQAEVDKGVFEAHQTAPLFHDINGILELKKRQFSLKNINARFGLSPLTMEGGISDFGLPYPTIYTAEMRIQPVRNELVWLLGEENFRELTFKGPSTLVLSGKGTDEDFRINALWDMTNAAYSYANVFEKQAARKNRLAADMIITPDAVSISSFDYDLPPVNIKGSMMVRFNGKVPASFSIRSNAFEARDAAALLPFLRQLNPAGTGAVNIAGKGDLSDLASMQWNGNIALNNISLKIADDIKPLKGLTGSASFKGGAMETSLFKGQLGSSSVQGKVRADDLRKPQYIGEFNANTLKAADLGLQSDEGDVVLRDVKAKIAFRDKMVFVENLSFGLGESGFSLTGQISDLDRPEVSLNLDTSYLSSDDLLRLMSLRQPKKEKPSSMMLDATITARAGKLTDIDFTDLKAILKYSQEIIDFETLEANCFDGKFKANGKVNLHSGGKHQYDADISIRRMSLDHLQNYLDIGDRTITGRLTLRGNVTAAGSTFEELQKTAEGKFQIRADKGVLKKYSVLSKIFSLLNVLQLAKLKLPDVTTEGMAYNAMTADIAIHEGVLSSDNFFINSDSLQFSSTGKIDLISKKLDLIVGVHPLQSLDFIASKIPVAGWLITDERGKLVTLHFKVDGMWENPDVSPMTAKSIGRGTLDIFKKIFQLPEKLITDTGDVILGR
jgi:uncharacterized protein involved in outer membrane biogenesis